MATAPVQLCPLSTAEQSPALFVTHPHHRRQLLNGLRKNTTQLVSRLKSLIAKTGPEHHPIGAQHRLKFSNYRAHDVTLIAFYIVGWAWPTRQWAVGWAWPNGELFDANFHRTTTRTLRWFRPHLSIVCIQSIAPGPEQLILRGIYQTRNALFA